MNFGNSHLQIMLSDPKFALRLFMGANVPYVYRLIGPNKWDAAEEVIRTVPHRVKKPLHTRDCRMRRHKRRGLTVSSRRLVYCSQLQLVNPP